MFVLEAMSFNTRSVLCQVNPPNGEGRCRLVWSAMGVACLLFCAACSQQAPEASTTNPSIPVTRPSAPLQAVAPTGPRWQDLTKEQRLILRPLAGTWDSLAGTHKSKWIAVAQSYPSRAASDQEKMQARMVEWASLTTIERERARLNFAESKKLGAADRVAEWAAYQELSPEEKKRLAAKGAPGPVGAATAIAPIANDKLTAVPVTRRTAQQADSTTVAKPQIDPNTLLPKLTPPTPSAPAPAITDTATPLGGTPAITIDSLSPN